MKITRESIEKSSARMGNGWTLSRYYLVMCAEKAAGVKPNALWYWWGSDTPAVNASFLLDMVTIFPDCKEARYRTELSPLYFCGDNGDGILLPVRRAECPEFESRWNELHKSAG